MFVKLLVRQPPGLPDLFLRPCAQGGQFFYRGQASVPSSPRWRRLRPLKSLKNARLPTAAILKTVKLPYLRNRLTDFDEIKNDDANWRPTGEWPLKFRFPNEKRKLVFVSFYDISRCPERCVLGIDSLRYVEATILELLRYKTLGPMALPHRTMKDTELDGYFIRL